MGWVWVVLIAVFGIPAIAAILILPILLFVSFAKAVAESFPVFAKSFVKSAKEFADAIKEDFGI